ncbi:MAG: hypothetical protein EBU90_16815 [Proteobacteria bacterium]|nr:hypothetical protein [Pseudomonadota bacterium]
MIITSVSHVGDFLRSIPSLWRCYEKEKEQYVFMFTKNYRPYLVIEDLLRMQEFTKDVVYVDVGTNAFNPTDYAIKPSEHGYDDSHYVNLNLNYNLKYPIAEYYGELLGGYEPDYSFRYNLPPSSKKHYKYQKEAVGVSDTNKGDSWLQLVPPNVDIKLLSLKNTLIDNILYAKYAKAVYTPSNLFAHILEFCNVKMTIYFQSSTNPNILHHNQNVVQFY